ncbi:hypothetical protein IM737_06550 [Devosia sp. SL43]|nr:hypothetical protein IM737_06550 [Devosia sp. SL43]
METAFRVAASEIGGSKPRKKRQPPFSIRLSQAERARLALDAAGAPLGAYVKEKLFDGIAMGRVRRKVLSIQDREAHARALALLGRSNLFNNLNQLAKAVHIGTLPVTPETEAELLAILNDVREIRRLFLIALGHQSEAAR